MTKSRFNTPFSKSLTFKVAIDKLHLLEGFPGIENIEKYRTYTVTMEHIDSTDTLCIRYVRKDNMFEVFITGCDIYDYLIIPLKHLSSKNDIITENAGRLSPYDCVEYSPLPVRIIDLILMYREIGVPIRSRNRYDALASCTLIWVLENKLHDFNSKMWMEAFQLPKSIYIKTRQAFKKLYSGTDKYSCETEYGRYRNDYITYSNYIHVAELKVKEDYNFMISCVLGMREKSMRSLKLNKIKDYSRYANYYDAIRGLKWIRNREIARFDRMVFCAMTATEPKNFSSTMNLIGKMVPDLITYNKKGCLDRYIVNFGILDNYDDNFELKGE